MMSERLKMARLRLKRDIAKARADKANFERMLADLEVQELGASQLISAVDNYTLTDDLALCQLEVEEGREALGRKLVGRKEQTPSRAVKAEDSSDDLAEDENEDENGIEEADNDEDDYISDVEASSAVDHHEDEEDQSRHFQEVVSAIYDSI